MKMKMTVQTTMVMTTIIKISVAGEFVNTPLANNNTNNNKFNIAPHRARNEDIVETVTYQYLML